MNGPEEKHCTDALIQTLCADLKPCKKLGHPFWRGLPWVLLAFAYVVGTVALQGFRIDISAQMAKADFVFELALVALMSVSAAFSCTWLCVPDARGQSWIRSVPLTLFFVFSLLLGLRMFLGGFVMPEIHWCFCYKSSILYGMIPALAIFVISSKGKTTHPNLLALMASLAVGGMGYFGLRLVCLSEDIGHILIIHTLPYVLFGFLASVLARRIYRW